MYTTPVKPVQHKTSAVVHTLYCVCGSSPPYSWDPRVLRPLSHAVYALLLMQGMPSATLLS